MKTVAGVVMLVGAAVASGGCLDALLGPRETAVSPVTVAHAARTFGGWRGTWRSYRGESGTFIAYLGPAGGDRVSGSVQFLGGRCARTAAVDGAVVNRTLILEGDLGGPCGAVTLSLSDSRSDVPRLVGSYRTALPEQGLFAIYPR